MAGSRRLSVAGTLVSVGLLIAIALVISGGAVGADQVTVSPDDSIQDAINESEPGDTIVVEDGTYEEELTVDVEDVEVVAADGDRPVLDGGDARNQSLNISATGVIVEGFDVQNYNQTDHGPNPPPVVSLESDDAELRNAVITDNVEVETVVDVTGDGATVSDVSVDGHEAGVGTDARAIRIAAKDVTVSNATVTDNDQAIFGSVADGTVIEDTIVESNRDRGIHLSNIDGFEIRDSVVVDNDEEGIYQTTGVSRHDVSDVTVRNTSIVGNGEGVWLSGGEDTTFKNNTIAETRGGIFVQDNATIVDNTLEDNTMAGTRTGGIRVWSNSTVADNEVTDVRGTGIFAGENTTIGDNELELTDGEQTGISITGNGNVVTDNEVSVDDSGIGMTISNGAGATVTDNVFDNGIVFTGYDDQAALADEPHEMENNVVNGDDLYYAANETAPDIDIDAAQVILVNVTDATVSDFDFEGVASEVQVAHSENITVTSNDVTDADPVAGTLQPSIGLWGTTNATVADNTIGGDGSFNQPDPLPNDRSGVHVGASETVTVESNEIFGALGGDELGAGTTDDHGINVAESDAVTVDNNVVDGFTSGIDVGASTGVTVRGSTISDVGPGVDAGASEDVEINDNAIEDVEEGIRFNDVEGSVTTENTIQNADHAGIEGRDSHGFEIDGNEITNNGWGIELRDIDNDTRSTISSNLVSDSDSSSGLFLEAQGNIWDLENVSVTENVFEDNAGTGVVVDDPVGDDVAFSLNSMSGNNAGIQYDEDPVLNATDNWWGDESGPGGDVEDPETGEIADGDGDEIVSSAENVTFDPWLEVDPGDGVEAAFTFDPSAPDADEEITFNATGSASMGDIETYRWDLTGDGEVDETTGDPETTWMYDEDGAYEVTLEVEDVFGLTDETSATVSVGGLGDCTLIDESGHYELAGDVVGQSVCMEITADDVVFDGNGHTIEGAADSDENQLGISVEGADNVTVRDVTVSDWALGLEYSDANNGTVEDVVTEHSFNGFDLRNAHDNEVTNLTSRHHDNEALALGPLSGESTTGNTFTDVTAYDNERDPATAFQVGAIYVGTAASDNEFVGLTSTDSIAGVRTDGSVGSDTNTNTFTDVVAEDNDQYGLTLEAESEDVFENVTVSGNAWHGIKLDDTRGNELTNVTATNNDGTAIYLRGGSLFNTFESVTVTDNHDGAIGMSGADNNEFVDLDFRGNSGSTIVLSQNADANQFEDVTVADAGLHGIVVSENDVTDTTIEDVTVENVSEGLQIRGGETTVTNLTATDSDTGVRLTSDALDTQVTDVTAEDVGTGVFLAGEENNSISDVSVDDGDTGVGIGSGETNTVTNATVVNADVGAQFDSSAGGHLEQAVLEETSVSATGTDVQLNATSEPNTPPSDADSIGMYVEATQISDDAELRPLKLHYDEGDLGDVDPEALEVWRYDGEWADPVAEPYYTERNESGQYAYAFGATDFNTSTFGVFGDTDPDPIERGMLQGDVTDDEGLELEGAEILAVGQDVAEGNVTTSDTDGAYDSPPEGTYDLTITAPDHVEKTVQEVEVTAGEATDLDIEMEAIPDPGTLSGTVTDDEGDGIEFLPVKANDRETDETYSTTTSPEIIGGSNSGEYSLELPPGSYNVTFDGHAQGYETKTVEDVTIDEAETTNLDVTLEELEYPPEGTIELEEPIVEPQEDVTVEYAFENVTDDEATVAVGTSESDTENTSLHRVDEDGSITVDAAEIGGLKADDEVFAQLWDELDVDDPDPPVGAEPIAVDSVVVDDEPDPEGFIEGALTDADTDDPIADADVVLFDNETDDLVDNTTTASDGTYTFDTLEPGAYDLTASAEEYEGDQVTGVNVIDGESTTQDFELEPIPVLIEITDTNAPVIEGETLEANVSVENTGAQDVSETIELRDGEDTLFDNKTVDLDGGENKSVTLEWDTDDGDAGDHVLQVEGGSDDDVTEVTVDEFVPATFELSLESTNSPVNEDETFTVNATVENVGDESGAEAVELRDEDDELVANETVDLAAGESEAITFEWETDENDIGQYYFSAVVANESVAVPVAVQEIDLGISVTPNEPQLGETIMFQATDARNPTWDFGDGETAQGPVVFHEYTADVGEVPFGTNTVNVTDVDGTAESVDVTVPFPVFEWDPQPMAATSIDRDVDGTPLTGIEWEETFTARLTSYDSAIGSEAVNVDEFIFELGDETITKDPETDGFSQEAEATFDLGELEQDEELTVTAVSTDGGEWEMTEMVSVMETPDWLEEPLEDAEVDQEEGEITTMIDPKRVIEEATDIDELPFDGVRLELASQPLFTFAYDTDTVAATVIREDEGDNPVARILGASLEGEQEVSAELDSDLVVQSGYFTQSEELSDFPGPRAGFDAPYVGSVSAGITIDLRTLVEEHRDETLIVVEEGALGAGTTLGADATLDIAGCGVLAAASGSVDGKNEFGEDVEDRNEDDPTFHGEAYLDADLGVFCGPLEASEGPKFGPAEWGDGLDNGLLVAQEEWSDDELEWEFTDKYGDRPLTDDEVVTHADANDDLERLTDRDLEDTEPAIAAIDDELLVVWSAQDETKNVSDGRDLKYQRYNVTEDEWTGPESLTDDNTSDEYPTLAVSDEGVIAVWSTWNESIDEEAVDDPSDLLSQYEIAYAIDDGDGWSEPTVLTDTGRNANPAVSCAER